MTLSYLQKSATNVNSQNLQQLGLLENLHHISTGIATMIYLNLVFSILLLYRAWKHSEVARTPRIFRQR